MSPSLESQACACHGAGLTEMTAQDISETPEQTEKNTAQEEEIAEEKGGETPKGAHLYRSVRSPVDEEFLFTTTGFDQVADSYRLHSTKMEKPDNKQGFFELPRSSYKKDNDSTKLSHGLMSSQLPVGRVKGMQKVFENIGSKDDVIHHKVTAKSQQYGSHKEKKHKVPQDVPVTPGVHGPVYSKVYKPLSKDDLEKRREHVTMTVIDGPKKTDISTLSTVLQRNMNSNSRSSEIKSSTKKYIANVELTDRYHSDSEVNYSKARIQLLDHKLPPRIPTPPPHRTKNFSISLSSPRGWKNESVIVRSPLSPFTQRFGNQRNYSSPMSPQTSGIFVFPGGNASHVKLGSETQQNVRKHEQSLIQPRYITKSQHTKNSQESSKAESKPLSQTDVLHDVSHIVDEEEAIHKRTLLRFENTINNEMQENSIVNKDLGLGEMHKNQRNNSSPMLSQTSDMFLFPGGNTSLAELGLETQQNVRKSKQHLTQPIDIIKSHHTKNSQEPSKAECKPLSQADVLHDVCHIDEEEALHKRSLERFANTIDNEIANEDSGLEEMQYIFTDRPIAVRMLIEDTHQGSSTSDISRSRFREDCVDESMNTSTIYGNLRHNMPPVITQGIKQPDYSHDTYINQTLENTRENLNNHDNHTNKEVKNKYQPTIILRRSVNDVNHDSIHLTKRANNGEIRPYEASVSDQPLEEEIRTNRKHEVELKNKHAEFIPCEYNIENNLKPNNNTFDETLSKEANPLTDQGEEMSIVSDKGEHTKDLETDIMGPPDDEESKTDLSGRAVGEISSAPSIREAIGNDIEQLEMDITEDNNDFVLIQTVDKKEEDKTREVGETIDYTYSTHIVSKDKEVVTQEQDNMVSITTIDGLMPYLNDIDEHNRILRTIDTIDILEQPEQEVAELIDHLVNVKDGSLLAEDRSKYEQNIKSSDLLSIDKLDQVLHTDSNLNDVDRDILDHGQNVAVSAETECVQMENVSDITEKSTVEKKIINIIQENTDEVDLNTVGMKDQSILEEAVTKDEPVTVATRLFSSDLTVNTEVEQSNELMKNAEYNKDKAAQELIVVVDSSEEISEQPCNNLKEDPDNILNTGQNTNHLSEAHVLYENTAQTVDAIVDHNIQNTDLQENGAWQALDVNNQLVDNDDIGKTILGSEDGIFSDQEKDVVIQQPANESVDKNGEPGLDNAEQIGNTSSAREGLTVDNVNLSEEHTLDHLVDEARRDTLSHPDDSLNIPDTLLIEHSNLTGEKKEDHNLNEISQQIFTEETVEEAPGVKGQVEKVTTMQNDECLTDEAEDAVYDTKEDIVVPDVEKGKILLDTNDEIHEHTRVNIPDAILTSTDDQPSENTLMSQGIANQVTDEVSQLKSLAENFSLKEDQTETLINESPTVTLHSSDTKTTLQLANANEFQERKNIDVQDSNIYTSLNKLSGGISGVSLSDVGKQNDTGNMTGPNTVYPQVKQNSVEQTSEIVQHSHLSDSENSINQVKMTEHAINYAEKEETEASENMDIWVNKLRQLDTPEFMKHLREPRQPRYSALNRYATLPPIREDQGSPKSDRFNFGLPFPEIKEKKILSEESKSTAEPKVAEQTEKSEQGEKKYSWERNTEKTVARSSPLDLMRKHSGDEASRSDSYKTFIAQNLSQRQSSLIGSLLLSERLDNKTDTSEKKSYSRIESSFLLSSYMKPLKDKPKVTEEPETISVNATSENDAATTATNETATSAAEDPKQEDKVDSSFPKGGHVTDMDSTELQSKLDTQVSSALKVFPDAWHHPEKRHGKLNPRPGKIILFSEPDFRGHSYEIFSDVGNTCGWELQGTISARIIRGGWLLYEKSHFRGRRVVLLEGDTDLTCPWDVQDKSTENLQEDNKAIKSWIGSLRHVVQDFEVPRISLFMDENGEGDKITIMGAAPDFCVNGKPTKTESIIVHSGLWLLYSKPFFEGDPYILMPGGYPNRKAWNGHDSHLCSLQPARIGGPTVEKPNEPKILVFQHPEFEGHSWAVTRDLHSLQGEPNQQGERLTSVGSLKVLGGCWVAYEKEGFHGHQYLLEEGEYQNWSHWGGCSEELESLRHIRTDFSEPEIILYEKPGCLEGSCLRLNEALSDIEVAQYGTNTGSIQVLNGVWLAYENVDFSGEQYILEKGIYHSYHDWGAKDSQICSVQPVLQVGGQNLQYLPKIQLFSELNFNGDCMTHTEERLLLPNSFSPQSCRIEGGSWILYEGEDCCGEQYILVEGDYPTRTAMGCQAISIIRSLKMVPLYFSIPSISLHGLERFEGKELEFTGAVRSLQGEGYNNHVLSIKVASGIWVLFEHSDFRGRQWLLEPTQITNWLLFSGIQRIGSLCPIRQRRVYFRLRNRALDLFLCVPEPADNIKAARVQVTHLREGSCYLWYYEEGRIKNQMTPQMSLQVVGMTTSGTKVVMWSEGRKPIQTWSLEDSGLIRSCLFEGLCLDIKGGQSYDSDHVVVWETAEDRLTQCWDLEVF